MRILHITQHLSVDELEHHYRTTDDSVTRSHWQIIWLHALGKTALAIAAVTGYSTTWIYEILHRYDTDGPDGVGDRRHQNPGQSPLVPPHIRKKLADALQGPAPDGGLWTSKKVAAWLEQELGVEHVHMPRGWELLRQLGYRSYVPRPCHRNADPAEQDARKKNFLTILLRFSEIIPMSQRGHCGQWTNTALD
jgi:transposase